jgi:hypothetical protein
MAVKAYDKSDEPAAESECLTAVHELRSSKKTAQKRQHYILQVPWGSYLEDPAQGSFQVPARPAVPGTSKIQVPDVKLSRHWIKY